MLKDLVSRSASRVGEGEGNQCLTVLVWIRRELSRYTYQPTVYWTVDAASTAVALKYGSLSTIRELGFDVFKLIRQVIGEKCQGLDNNSPTSDSEPQRSFGYDVVSLGMNRLEMSRRRSPSPQMVLVFGHPWTKGFLHTYR